MSEPSANTSAPANTNAKPQYTLISGSHDAQGRRDTMEDAHKHIDDFKKEAGYESLNTFSQIAYYAVYDGHGGDQTAKMVEKELHNKIFKSDEFSRKDIAGAFNKGFEDMDKIVVEEANKVNQMHGSTCVASLVLDGKLYVANIGDSEGILISVANNQITPTNLTRPHKASDPAEKERIEALGGHVFFGRVFGALAVSRSFGDAKYKKPKTSKDFVSWEPDMQTVELNTSHRYLVLACDGLWDVINHQQTAELTHRSFLEGQTPQQVAKTLVKTALQRRTEDNVTVIVVKIQWEGIEDPPVAEDDSTPTTDSTESDDDSGEGENAGESATTTTTTTSTTTTTEATQATTGKDSKSDSKMEDVKSS